MRIPELLAPVGSMEHLKVAINAGASSVYLSGKEYGARKYATNFTLDEINDAINTAHMHNVKVYVTVNTLIKEDELEDVINYVSKLYAMGVDAVLVQDLGLIELINKHVPKLKIHASTQITCENQLKVDYLKSKGLKHISQLNISCIKIEGRMRKKENLAIVISGYRKALNKLKSNKELKNENISLVFNRGFCTGLFDDNPKRSLKAGHIGL